MRRRHEPRGWHARRPPGRGTFWFQIFIQAPSPEIWSETISGGEEVLAQKWGGLVLGYLLGKNFRRRDRDRLVPPRCMECSSRPCRGVLSFRSEAREASGSETPRVHNVARWCGGVAARGTCATASHFPAISTRTCISLF